jgi:hypothetical protein
VLTFRQKAPVLRAASHRLLRRALGARALEPPAPAPHALERYATPLAPLGLAVDGRAGGRGGRRPSAGRASGSRRGDPPRRRSRSAPARGISTKRWPEAHWIALDDALSRRGTPRIWFSLTSRERRLPALAARSPPTRTRAGPPSLAAHGGAAVALPRGRHVRQRAHAPGRGARASGGRDVRQHVARARLRARRRGHEVLCRNEPCQPCTLHGRERCPMGHFRAW